MIMEAGEYKTCNVDRRLQTQESWRYGSRPKARNVETQGRWLSRSSQKAVKGRISSCPGRPVFLFYSGLQMIERGLLT